MANFARVAQLVEHRPCKSVVAGSTPAAGSTFPGKGARGPGVAALESTAAAPVFNFSSNVHGCALSAPAVGRRGLS